MPAFRIDQKDEMDVWNLGFAAAEAAGYSRLSAHNKDVRPLAATAFAAGFMGGAFLGQLPSWIEDAFEPEVLCWIKEGYTKSQKLNGEYIGMPYEANTAGETTQEDRQIEQIIVEGVAITFTTGCNSGPSPEEIVEMITGPLSGEIWRPITYYPGGFVSNLGRVRDWKGFRKTWISPSRSHPSVEVPYGGSKFVHCIVAETWLGPRPEGQVICHKNDNKLDARVVNLRYDTHEENMKDWARNRLNYIKPISKEIPLEIGDPVAKENWQDDWIPIGTILTALQERRRLKIKYEDTWENRTEYVIEPYFINWEHGYILTWCSLRKELQIVYCHAIIKWELLSESFERDPLIKKWWYRLNTKVNKQTLNKKVNRQEIIDFEIQMLSEIGAEEEPDDDALPALPPAELEAHMTGWNLMNEAMELLPTVKSNNLTDYAEAVRLFLLSIERGLTPFSMAVVHRKLGEIYLECKDKKNAISHFENALKWNPKIGVRKKLNQLLP